MGDEVKKVFTTLIKVPFIIAVVYFIFNIFAFSFVYFRLLGFSYVVMQTAVENNYLPTSEYNQLNTYLSSITNMSMVDNARIVTNVDGSGIEDATVKRQYGAPVIVGVSAHFRVIWPLMPHETRQDPSNGFVVGLEGGTMSAMADSATLESRREEYANNPNNNITIVYKVPGLQYYPDLAN